MTPRRSLSAAERARGELILRVPAACRRMLARLCREDMRPIGREVLWLLTQEIALRDRLERRMAAGIDAGLKELRERGSRS